MRKYLTYLDSESYLFWKIEVTGRSFLIEHGKMGTFGKKEFRILAGEIECLKIAKTLVEEKMQQGYVTTGEGYIATYELPSELKKSLAEERIVKTEYGSFVLFAHHDITLITVTIDHHFRDSDDLPAALGANPYSNQKGLFCTTAYSLVKESPETYQTDGLLVWLPLLELFGTWNRTLKQLHLFEKTPWTSIEKDLGYYLAGDTKVRFPNMLAREKVLDYFDFIPDDLPAKIKSILSHPVYTNQAEVEDLLGRYEQRLLRHPWCSELEGTYEALVNLYHRMGQAHERDAEYEQAIEWLGRSLLVVNQSHHFRSKVFIDIFIQLSFCYFETSKFDSSLRYMKMYQVYDSKAWETCEQIITSISRVQQLYEEAMASGQKAIQQRSAECYEEAIRITHEAIKIAPNDPLLHFNLACFYSLSYKTKEALYHLEEAIKKGYKDKVKIANEQDLENIRSTREFKEIHQRYF